jgi:hypothetical protein
MGIDPRSRTKARRLARFYGIWFLCLGAGFLLLGIRSWMLGDVAWRTVIRFVISAGFVAGAIGYLRDARGKR